MMHVTLILADTIIVADYVDDRWYCRFSNAHSGRFWTSRITHRQLSAIMALAIGGDDDNPLPVKMLYAVAESALFDCPPECRPIP